MKLNLHFTMQVQDGAHQKGAQCYLLKYVFLKYTYLVMFKVLSTMYVLANNIEHATVY